ELLHQPRHHPDGDVDEQQGPEEAGQPSLLGITRPVPQGVEDRDEEGQADGDRHEQEVVDARGRELHPSEVDVHRMAPLSAGSASKPRSRTHCAAYGPSAATSSPWVPRSTTRPACSTTISSIASSPARRWVIITVVRPHVISTRSRISASPVAVSRCSAGSSRI